MKKIGKWIGIGFGAIILLIIISSIIVMMIVDEKMIADQMESALNRKVIIKDISAGIFSVVSGIEVHDVQISNFKKPKQLKALKGKPIKKGDLFVGMESFIFNVKFLPLFSGEFVLTSLTLNKPQINVIKYKSGAFNFDDLTRPDPNAKKEAKKEKKKEPAKKKKPAKPGKAFTADDLPVSITIGKVGIVDGVLKFVDKKLGQSFQVYNLTAMVHSIDIDPEDLENNDFAGLKVEMGVKTIGQVKTGTVKSFDIGFDIDGDIIPFDKKTRIAEPEITLEAGLPYGKITGLQIFENMKSVDSLSKYCGKLNFLKKDIEWKDAYVEVWYKAGVVKLKNGEIKTGDYKLNFQGQTNTKTKAINLDMDMLLADKHQKTIRTGIDKNVRKGVKGKYAKYVKPEKITDIAMKRLVDKNGKVFLKYKVKGTMSKPKSKLVHPKLPTIKELIKDSAGDVADVVKDQAKDLAKKQADKQKEKAKEKGKEKAKKQADKLKKKFGF